MRTLPNGKPFDPDFKKKYLKRKEKLVELVIFMIAIYFIYMTILVCK